MKDIITLEYPGDWNPDFNTSTGQATYRITRTHETGGGTYPELAHTRQVYESNQRTLETVSGVIARMLSADWSVSGGKS